MTAQSVILPLPSNHARFIVLRLKDLSIEEHVEHLIQEKQLKSKDAIKEVSIQRGLPKREVYQSYHVE